MARHCLSLVRPALALAAAATAAVSGAELPGMPVPASVERLLLRTSVGLGAAGRAATSDVPSEDGASMALRVAPQLSVGSTLAVSTESRPDSVRSAPSSQQRALVQQIFEGRR